MSILLHSMALNRRIKSYRITCNNNRKNYDYELRFDFEDYANTLTFDFDVLCNLTAIFHLIVNSINALSV